MCSLNTVVHQARRENRVKCPLWLLCSAIQPFHWSSRDPLCKLSFCSPSYTAVAVLTMDVWEPLHSWNRTNLRSWLQGTNREITAADKNTDTESPLHGSGVLLSSFLFYPLSLGLLLLSQPTPLCSIAVSLIPKRNGIQMHTSSSQEGRECLSKQLVPGALWVRAPR